VLQNNPANVSQMTIVLDLSHAFREMEAQTNISERGLRSVERILDEMLTQVFDFLQEATPRNNYFAEHHKKPNLVLGLLVGVNLNDRQMCEELQYAFLHLYVNVRDALENILGATAYVNERGAFEFAMWRRVSNHTVVLRHIPDFPE
jgi:hypothetical protein